LNWLNLLGIAVGLAMDAFAVSIAAGLMLETVTPRHVFRIGWHFGLFQFMMPIAGWWLGSRVSHHIEAYDRWLAFGLLGIVGGKMLMEAWRGDRQGARSNPTKGWMLVSLSVATSIDALAVGLSLAFLAVPILLPSIVIGIVAAGFSTAGITLAGRLFRGWGRGAEMLGGSVLILIGVRILIANFA
jgi:putative Mn2+ efflux pump MntP